MVEFTESELELAGPMDPLSRKKKGDPHSPKRGDITLDRGRAPGVAQDKSIGEDEGYLAKSPPVSESSLGTGALSA